MKTPIENAWQELCRQVWTADLDQTNPEQYLELRAAFYAGVHYMLNSLLEQSNDIQKELNHFLATMYHDLHHDHPSYQRERF